MTTLSGGVGFIGLEFVPVLSAAGESELIAFHVDDSRARNELGRQPSCNLARKFDAFGSALAEPQ